jgi:hypothetical protein
MQTLSASSVAPCLPCHRRVNLRSLLRRKASYRETTQPIARIYTPPNPKSHPPVVVQRQLERDLRFLIPLLLREYGATAQTYSPIAEFHTERQTGCPNLTWRRDRTRITGARRDLQNHEPRHHLRTQSEHSVGRSHEPRVQEPDRRQKS